MKKNTHPATRDVVFKDMVTGSLFKMQSTVETADQITFTDGRIYPLVKVEVSSASHPVYTGEARVERLSSRRTEFERKYKRA